MAVVLGRLWVLCVGSKCRVGLEVQCFGGSRNRSGVVSACNRADHSSKLVVADNPLPLKGLWEVIDFLLVVVRQRLILSGDVERNPGPLDHGIYLDTVTQLVGLDT